MALNHDLGQDECHVWVARVADAGSHLMAMLDPGERARWSALGRPADRKRFLAGHALLRRVLGHHLGVDPAAVPIVNRCDRCGGSHGRPRVVSRDRVEVSLSHTGDCVAVALTRGARVGVDVEPVRPRVATEALARRVLTPTEAAAWRRTRAHDRPRVLLRFWTRKEALTKALGLGLALPFHTIDGSLSDHSPTVVDLGLDPGHVGSVAVLRPYVRVVQHREAA